jgi:hypothetical protein
MTIIKNVLSEAKRVVLRFLLDNPELIHLVIEEIGRMLHL